MAIVSVHNQKDPGYSERQDWNFRDTCVCQTLSTHGTAKCPQTASVCHSPHAWDSQPSCADPSLLYLLFKAVLQSHGFCTAHVDEILARNWSHMIHGHSRRSASPKLHSTSASRRCVAGV
jgi:hypothetical protein